MQLRMLNASNTVGESEPHSSRDLSEGRRGLTGGGEGGEESEVEMGRVKCRERWWRKKRSG